MVAGAYATVSGIHNALGLDPQDPRTTWHPPRFEPPADLLHEDISGNLVHGALILAALAALVASARLRRRYPNLGRIAVLSLLSFGLFAGYLKWTPWHSRLQLTLFLLLSPIVGVFLARLARPWKIMIGLILLAQAIPFLISNPLRPLIGPTFVFAQSRFDQTFSQRPLLGELYAEAGALLAATNCRDVGLALPGNAWEYPLWSVLRRAASQQAVTSEGTLPPTDPSPFRIENTLAHPATHDLLDTSFEPCAIICLRCAQPKRNEFGQHFGDPILSAPDDLPDGGQNMVFLKANFRQPSVSQIQSTD